MFYRIGLVFWILCVAVILPILVCEIRKIVRAMRVEETWHERRQRLRVRHLSRMVATWKWNQRHIRCPLCRTRIKVLNDGHKFYMKCPICDLDTHDTQSPMGFDGLLDAAFSRIDREERLGICQPT